jgi:hypothetical protein
MSSLPPRVEIRRYQLASSSVPDRLDDQSQQHASCKNVTRLLFHILGQKDLGGNANHAAHLKDLSLFSLHEIAGLDHGDLLHRAC